MEPRPEKEKRQYPSPAQKTRLAQLLEADAELRSGKFTSSFTKKTAAARWERIAEEVNSITGVKKSGKDWRSTWIDMKSYIKKKYAGQKKSIRSTGGGPPDDSTLSADEIILGTISESALAGHSDSQESRATFIDFQPELGSVEVKVVEEHMEWEQNPSTSMATIPVDNEPTNSAAEHPSTSMATVPVDTEPRNSAAVQPPSTSMASNQRKPKRTVAQKRLQNSLDTAQALHLQIKEKLKMKKEFNDTYLYEMRRRTDAILELANSIRSLKDT